MDTTCTELTDAGEQALLGLTGREVIVSTNKNLQVELDQVTFYTVVCRPIQYLPVISFSDIAFLLLSRLSATSSRVNLISMFSS